MDTTVDVIIPVDAEAARALESPARREAAGRYLSGLLKGGRAPMCSPRRLPMPSAKPVPAA